VKEVVPQLTGTDLAGLISQIQGEPWDQSKPIFQSSATGDLVEVFLE
jgi:hypothetical protein